jgi:AraC-like DNA-binding protein
MNPVTKALWFIEIELGDELTLARIASNCGMSRFGLSRLFANCSGLHPNRCGHGANSMDFPLWSRYV